MSKEEECEGPWFLYGCAYTSELNRPEHLSRQWGQPAQKGPQS